MAITKQQLQIATLSAASVIFVAVLFYFYRDAVLPQPTPAAPLPESVVTIDVKQLDTKITEREEYRSSRTFGGPDLNPVIVAPSNPFRAVENGLKP